jgi:hypothetical protein
MGGTPKWSTFFRFVVRNPRWLGTPRDFRTPNDWTQMKWRSFKHVEWFVSTFYGALSLSLHQRLQEFRQGLASHWLTIRFLKPISSPHLISMVTCWRRPHHWATRRRQSQLSGMSAPGSVRPPMGHQICPVDHKTPWFIGFNIGSMQEAMGF